MVLEVKPIVPNVYLSEISTECPECAQLQKIVCVGGAHHLLRRLVREAEMVRLVKDSEENEKVLEK